MEHEWLKLVMDLPYYCSNIPNCVKRAILEVENPREVTLDGLKGLLVYPAENHNIFLWCSDGESPNLRTLNRLWLEIIQNSHLRPNDQSRAISAFRPSHIAEDELTAKCHYGDSSSFRNFDALPTELKFQIVKEAVEAPKRVVDMRYLHLDFEMLKKTPSRCPLPIPSFMTVSNHFTELVRAAVKYRPTSFRLHKSGSFEAHDESLEYHFLPTDTILFPDYIPRWGSWDFPQWVNHMSSSIRKQPIPGIPIHAFLGVESIALNYDHWGGYGLLDFLQPEIHPLQEQNEEIRSQMKFSTSLKTLYIYWGDAVRKGPIKLNVPLASQANLSDKRPIPTVVDLYDTDRLAGLFAMAQGTTHRGWLDDSFKSSVCVHDLHDDWEWEVRGDVLRNILWECFERLPLEDQSRLRRRLESDGYSDELGYGPQLDDLDDPWIKRTLASLPDIRPCIPFDLVLDKNFDHSERFPHAWS